MTLRLLCQLLPSNGQGQVSHQPSLPVSLVESTNTQRSYTVSRHRELHTPMHTQPVAMHSAGSIQVWGFQSVCRRNTASTKLFNPIIPLSSPPVYLSAADRELQKSWIHFSHIFPKMCLLKCCEHETCNIRGTTHVECGSRFKNHWRIWQVIWDLWLCVLGVCVFPKLS